MEMVDVVDLLVDYIARERARPGSEPNKLGDPVLAELARYLQSQLEQHTGFTSLYEAFQKDPQGTSAELTGALEAIVEGDPEVRETLNALVDEYVIVTHTETPGTETEENIAAEEEEENLDAEELPGTATEVVDQTNDYFEGEYLYGTANTRRGSESEGRVIDVNEDVSMGLDEDDDDLEGLGMHVEEIPGIFTQVAVAVEEHPNLSPQVKDRILSHLNAISAQVALGDGANRSIIRRHLDAIQHLSPDIMNVLMEEEGFQDFLQNPGEE